MKPHLLTMEAFGPYAQPARIPFDGLSQEGLFLIHGSTGAGKTFLLDALCFALYGEVSGDRNVKGLKSDHAAPGAVPRVGLEFSCGAARYWVERSPAHSAPKVRGEGLVDKAPAAVLFRLKGAQREPIASRVTEVTREVEGLIGLSAAQFRQVILLPQGKFAEVLRARAEERETLLRTLFNTVVFERAASWLEERWKGARLRAIEAGQAQEVVRQQAAREWTPWRGDGEAGEVPGDQAGVDRLQAQLAQVVAAATAQLKQAAEGLEAAETARQASLALADRWTRRATATARLAELEGKAEVVETFRQRLRRAERAEALRPSLEAERAARAALAVEQERVEALLRQVHRAREGAQALPPVVTGLDLAQLPSLAVISGAATALAARRAEVGALVGKAEEALRAGVRERQAAEELGRTEAACLEAAAALEAKGLERQAAAEASERARTARDQLDGLRRAAEEAQRQAEAVAALPAARAKASGALAAQQAAEARRHGATTALLELRRRQISGMAAHLAQGLVAGAPCPVCGATHHPAPAIASEASPSEAAIQTAEAEVTAASEAALGAAAAVARAAEELKALAEKAGPAAQAPEAARDAALEAAQALASARASAQAIGGLERTLAAHDQALKALADTLQQGQTRIALLRDAVGEAAQRARGLREEIRQELGEGIDPRAALAAFDPLERALAALAASGQAHGRALSRQEDCAARLAQDLAATDFATPQAAEAAMEEAGLRERMAERIAAYEKEVIELRGLLAAEDLAGLPEACPDLAAAEAAWRSADGARVAALERLSQARTSEGALARLAAEHREGEVVLAQRREEAQLLNRVADRCLGRSAPYVSLQRWVLAAYLEEICGHANLRLELMTSGRYQLRLSDEGGRGGRQAGLGLKVLDAFTGEEREVSSLSGGETFQASLALALGVADTVEARSGGLHLEALFIDEGFGTLDPDNLQLAMDELDRLREGGRMIGIISHVGALKERIQAGIEVTSGDRGSTARVVRTVME
jgi:exonuclease SbcC